MPAGPEVYECILQQQAGREPLRLAKKFDLIAGDPFAFFRGTSGLFYESLPALGALRGTPRVLCCGDLHLENFGSFRGANRLVYFDLNDFDEACVAPLAFELLRFVASIHAGAASLGLSDGQADRLSKAFVKRYAAVLAAGKPAWLERLTARGLVKQLLERLRDRHRIALLDERTHLREDGRRELRVDGKRILAIPAKEKKHVKACLKAYARTQAAPGFYRILDIGARVAGNGSLGLPRYIVLVAGRGAPNGHFLLDLKAATPSALAPHVRGAQPKWSVEGERVVALQKVMVAMAPALLAPVKVDGASFVLKELQPSSDRLDLQSTRGDLEILTEVVQEMAQLTAWAQLRGCARYGAATPDELMDFGARAGWQAPLRAAAREAAERNLIQWQAFRKEHLRLAPPAGKEAPAHPAPGSKEKSRDATVLKTKSKVKVKTSQASGKAAAKKAKDKARRKTRS